MTETRQEQVKEAPTSRRRMATEEGIAALLKEAQKPLRPESLAALRGVWPELSQQLTRENLMTRNRNLRRGAQSS